MKMCYITFKRKTERKIEMAKDWIKENGETKNVNFNVIKGLESSLRLAESLKEEIG